MNTGWLLICKQQQLDGPLPLFVVGPNLHGEPVSTMACVKYAIWMLLRNRKQRRSEADKVEVAWATKTVPLPVVKPHSPPQPSIETLECTSHLTPSTPSTCLTLSATVRDLGSPSLWCTFGTLSDCGLRFEL